MELLLNVDAVSSDQNLRSLRRLYDTIESHIRSLKSLVMDSTSYGALLCPVLLNKLPPDIRLIINRKVASSKLNMDHLLKAFEEELEAREQASDSTYSQPRRNYDKGRHTPTSALVFKAQESAAGMTCCYCQQPHSSLSCTSVTSVGARKQILKTSSRCFNRLRKGHLSRNCRSSRKCQKCKGRHHTSICGVQDQHEASHQPATLSLAQPSATTSTTRLDPAAPTYTPTLTMNALYPDNQKTVLLQTARSILHNPSNPAASLEVRLLLDTGSQKSYITERARSLLSLESKGEQHLSIATFGSDREQTKVCPIVHVGMQLRDYPSMALSLYVVPTICEPLISQPINVCMVQNPGLMGRLQVDVLIGSDYYWDLVFAGVMGGLQLFIPS